MPPRRRTAAASSQGQRDDSPQEAPVARVETRARGKPQRPRVLRTLLTGLVCGLAVSLGLSPQASDLRASFASLLPRFQPATQSPRLVTHQQLALRDGSRGDPLWLAVCGQVFDVTSGRKHYGPDGGYSFFTGKDGSAAFVTGVFNETGLTDDVAGLNQADLASLDTWRQFYHNEYSFVGLLAGGRFYDVDGTPLEPVALVQAAAASERSKRSLDAAVDAMTPSCSASWTAVDGGRVWCDPPTGQAAAPATVAVPRQIVDVAASPPRVLKCGCVALGPLRDDVSEEAVRELATHGRGLRTYPGCPPAHTTCTSVAPDAPAAT